MRPVAQARDRAAVIMCSWEPSTTIPVAVHSGYQEAEGSVKSSSRGTGGPRGPSVRLGSAAGCPQSAPSPRESSGGRRDALGPEPVPEALGRDAG